MRIIFNVQCMMLPIYLCTFLVIPEHRRMIPWFEWLNSGDLLLYIDSIRCNLFEYPSECWWQFANTVSPRKLTKHTSNSLQIPKTANNWIANAFIVGICDLMNLQTKVFVVFGSSRMWIQRSFIRYGSYPLPFGTTPSECLQRVSMIPNDAIISITNINIVCLCVQLTAINWFNFWENIKLFTNGRTSKSS